MLPVRQVTSSLLRHSIRQQFQSLSLPSLSLITALPLETRSFSKNLRSHGRRNNLAKVKMSGMDLPSTLKAFDDIQHSKAIKLTENQASTLVISLIKHQRLSECVELMQTFQKHQVQLKPAAKVKCFSVLCRMKKFKLILAEFESLSNDKSVNLMPWMVGGALDAATRLNQQQIVKGIFQQLFETEEIQVSGDGVYEMFQDVREKGVTVPEFAFQALVIFADKSNQPDMALDVLAMMHNEGIKPVADVYSSVLMVLGKNERWSDVVKAFEEIPGKMVSQLKAGLDHVVMAYTQGKNEELTMRGLEIFGQMEKRTKLAYTAALQGLLQTDQLDVLLALANDMKCQGMVWDSFVCKMVALAYIRSGSIDKARIFLHTNSKHMQGDSASCYRELISHYADKNGDVDGACQIYLEMIQNKQQLTLADWSNALELALEGSDQGIYWRLRKLLWVNDRDATTGIPDHLLLPDLDGLEGFAFQQKATQTAPLKNALVQKDLSEALTKFQGIKEADGAGLTVNIASRLLEAVGKHNRVNTCQEMWRYFETLGVFPKLFARSAAFAAVSKTKRYEFTLDIFKTLMADKAAPSAWAYPKALEAAIQLNKHSTVTEIVRDMQDRDIKFTVFDYTEIIRMFAEAKQWTLAHSMVSAMQKHKMNPPSDTYNLLLTGCGNDRYWNIVIEAYTAMSDDRKLSLDAKALSSVLLAFSQAENEELQERTVTICNDHKKTCKPFPYEMALIALLEAKQHQEVISLAAEATHHGFELTPLMHHMVVKAHLGSGSMEQARQLLDENAKRLSNISVECYRELITYYAEVREDTLKASTMCVLMMENNTKVSVNDWRTALELALQLPDRTTYWELRKLLRVHEVPLSEFRSHLLLLEDDHQLDRYR